MTNLFKAEYDKNLLKETVLLSKITDKFRLKALRKDFANTVRTVNIETTSWCNIVCSFCPSKNLNRKHHVMSHEMFIDILKQLKQIDYEHKIELHQSNEPLTDVAIVRRVALVREALPEAIIGFYTNGTLLTEDKLLRLHDVGLTYMLIGSTSSKVLTNAKRIACYVQRFRDDVDVLIEGNVSLYNTLEYMNKTNDRLKIGIRDTSKQLLTSRCNTVSQAEQVNLFCSRPFERMQINYDGTVQLCCEEWLRKGDSIVGDLKTNTLLEIWYGSAIQNYREMLTNNERTKYPCNVCDFIDSKTKR